VVTSNMRANAERNDDGRLIWEKSIGSAAGGSKTREIDVTALLNPGPRKTGNIDHLVIEAKLHERGEGGGNPAKPVDSDIAKRAIERLDEEGLEPAWRQVDELGDFP